MILLLDAVESKKRLKQDPKPIDATSSDQSDKPERSNLATLTTSPFKGVLLKKCRKI